jgi:hypothetical protein
MVKLHVIVLVAFLFLSLALSADVLGYGVMKPNRSFDASIRRRTLDRLKSSTMTGSPSFLPIISRRAESMKMLIGARKLLGFFSWGTVVCARSHQREL